MQEPFEKGKLYHCFISKERVWWCSHIVQHCPHTSRGFLIGIPVSVFLCLPFFFSSYSSAHSLKTCRFWLGWWETLNCECESYPVCSCCDMLAPCPGYVPTLVHFKLGLAPAPPWPTNPWMDGFIQALRTPDPWPLSLATTTSRAREDTNICVHLTHCCNREGLLDALVRSLD